MKVTKTSVHRLTIEKGCGCKATREYEDVRYTKPLSEATFTACEKHDKNKAFAEFAGEMLIEALDKEAETAGKNAFVPNAPTPTALSGTSGETVQSMGAPTMPKTREKRDPLAPRTAAFDRPDPHKPSGTGHLNIAMPVNDLTDEEMAEAGITMDGDIEGVAADPRVDKQMQKELGQLEDILDAQDAKEAGVPLALLRDAE